MQATIKAKLTLGLGFLFLVILLLSGVGAYFLYQLARSSEATLHDNYRSVAYAGELTNALADLAEARRDDSNGTAANSARQSFERYLAAEQRNITEPGEGVVADSLARGFRAYLQAPPATSRPSYQQLRRQVSRVAALNLRAIEQQNLRTRRLATRTITTLGLLAALGILATFSFIFSFPDYVTKPVEELTSGIRRLATGDYSQRLPEPAYREFAGVASAFNDMAQKLEGYETPEGTPRLDHSDALERVTVHHRPSALAGLPDPAEQRRLLLQLREQTQLLARTTERLLY